MDCLFANIDALACNKLLCFQGSYSSGVGIQHASEKNIPVPETAEAG